MTKKVHRLTQNQYQYKNKVQKVQNFHVFKLTKFTNQKENIL